MRECEQHREQEDRHPGLDSLHLLEAQQVDGEAVLEDQDEQAVGRTDREQVEDDGGDGDDQGAEDEGEQEEAQPEDEGQHDRQPMVDDVGVVDVLRGGATDQHGGGSPVECGGNQVAPEAFESAAGLGVVWVADQRDADQGHLAVVGDLLL